MHFYLLPASTWWHAQSHNACSPHLKTGVCCDFTPSLSPLQPTQSSGVRARFGHNTVGEKKAHRISARRKAPRLLIISRGSQMIFCSDDTSTYDSNFSLNNTWRESDVCFGSPKFLHDQTFANFPINSVLFFVFDPVCWRGSVCQVQPEHCVEKEKTKYILNKTERERRCIPLRTNQQHMHLVGLLL